MLELVKREKLRLAPFGVTVALFFLIVQPLWGLPEEAFLNAILKMLPIWSLAYYVMSTSEGEQPIKSLKIVIPYDSKSQLVLLGISLSSLGDFCVLFRTYLAPLGVLFFLVAQVFYIASVREHSEGSRTKAVFLLGLIASYLELESYIDSYIFKAFIFIYWGLVWYMGWRMTARFEVEGDEAALAGCIGGVAFIISDFVILTCPMAEFLVMVLYYTAQLGITLSTCQKSKAI